jgi:hypothetical protein
MFKTKIRRFSPGPPSSWRCLIDLARPCGRKPDPVPVTAPCLSWADPTLKKNAVTSLKVKDGSLLAAAFKAGQLPAGATGPQGAQGPKGDMGATGPAGIAGVELVVGPTSIVNAGQLGGATAYCPAGKKVLGGGGGSEGNTTITNSGPGTDAQWGVNVVNNEAFAVEVAAYAICAKVG